MNHTTRSRRKGFWSLTLILGAGVLIELSVGALILMGCAGRAVVEAKVASPDVRVGSPETTVTVPIDSEIEQGGTGDDASAGGAVGRIGGNGDSIALWLAIAALAMTPLAYPASRTVRLAWKTLKREAKMDAEEGN